MQSLGGSSVCIALIDGEELKYDFASDNRDAYPTVNNKVYLGKGIIYKVNGVRQTFTNEEHFWRKRVIENSLGGK